MTPLKQRVQLTKIRILSHVFASTQQRRQLVTFSLPQKKKIGDDKFISQTWEEHLAK